MGTTAGTIGPGGTGNDALAALLQGATTVGIGPGAPSPGVAEFGPALSNAITSADLAGFGGGGGSSGGSGGGNIPGLGTLADFIAGNPANASTGGGFLGGGEGTLGGSTLSTLGGLGGLGGLIGGGLGLSKLLQNSGGEAASLGKSAIGGLNPLAALSILALSNKILNPMQPINLPDPYGSSDSDSQDQKKKKKRTQVIDNPLLQLSLI